MNEVVVSGDVAHVVVTDKRGIERGRILIDAASVALLGSRRWHEVNGGYLCSGHGPDFVLFHRVVTGVPAGAHVDHINGDRRDNRLANLRIVTPQQNFENFGTRASSGHRNVYVHPTGFTVYLMKNRVKYYGGMYRDLADAIAAAKALRAKHYTHAVESRH